MRWLAGALLLLIVGCTAVQPETPGQRLYTLQAGYISIASLAAEYVELPACGAAVVELCHEPDAKVQIKAASRRIRGLLATAQDVLRNGGQPDLTLVRDGLLDLRRMVTKHYLEKKQ
tara:strand:+ start:2256 stop:2606 length:351 start_codon:yes stop_codon:yes gene_type:complete